MEFVPSGIPEINSTLIKCVCAINPNCQNQAIITNPSINHWMYDNLTYNVPGSIQSCLSIDSLLLSTLQYLYVNSDFFPILLYSLNINFFYWYTTMSPSFKVQPLIYNPAVSRFPPNASISIRVKEIMVEQWNPSLSYQHFYEACAPIYCSYSQTIHKESFIGVIITLVSMLGGIVVSLRILTPLIVNFILRLLTRTNQKLTETEQGNHLFDQI